MQNNLTVLFLTHNYPRYIGDYSGIFLALLAKQLKKYDIRTIVLAPHDKDTKEYEIVDGITIYRFRYNSDENKQSLAYQGNMHSILRNPFGILKFLKFKNAFFKKTIEIIENEKIDLIAGHWLVPAGLVMKSLLRYSKIPMILSSHGTDIRLLKKFKILLAPYLSKLFKNLEHWTVVSTFLSQIVKESIGNNSDTLSVLPPATNEEIFFKDNSIERDPNLIVAVSRFTDQKRIPILIKAFEKVNQKNKNARLEIYGTGPDEDQIKKLFANSSARESITLNNPVDQIQLRTIYNRASIVVLNSYQEGFGLVLTEAMLCGAAVIGTDSGGITDIINHNKTGLLVEVDNVVSLADAFCLLLDDKVLQERLALAGNRYAIDHFSSEKVASAYADMIKSTVSNKL